MPLIQGLSQDFKTARPTQRRFQNNPSNPFWELVFTPLTNPEVTWCYAKKKEYSTMEAPLVGDNRRYGL